MTKRRNDEESHNLQFQCIFIVYNQLFQKTSLSTVTFIVWVERRTQNKWKNKWRTKEKHHKIPTIVSCFVIVNMTKLRDPSFTFSNNRYWNHWTKLAKHDYRLRNHFDIQIFEFHGEKSLVVCQSCDISRRMTKCEKQVFAYRIYMYFLAFRRP